MSLSNLFQSSLITFLVLCFLSVTVDVSDAVPIISTDYKKSMVNQSLEISRYAPPKVLGTYRDISHSKKRAKRPARLPSSSAVRKKLSAKSAIIMDSQSGQVLFSRYPDHPRQPASTIKILTGMIALKSLDKKEKVPVSRKAARQPRSKIYLDQQKQYKANDLINAVLLASANDASVALAEKIAGSEKSFANMMTRKAKLWGAKKTTCKNATGLTARGQRSTARDLAVMFRHAMQDPEFANRMKRTKVRTTDGKLLRNHNKALWQVKGTEGGKTGYTNAARQTYVGKFKRGNDEIIVAIMGSETMWTDIKNLVKFGFAKKNYLSAQSAPAKETDPVIIAEVAHP